MLVKITKHIRDFFFFWISKSTLKTNEQFYEIQSNFFWFFWNKLTTLILKIKFQPNFSSKNFVFFQTKLSFLSNFPSSQHHFTHFSDFHFLAILTLIFHSANFSGLLSYFSQFLWRNHSQMKGWYLFYSYQEIKSNKII